MLKLTKEQVDALSDNEVAMVFQIKQQSEQIAKMRRALKDDIEIEAERTKEQNVIKLETK